jgi:peptide/nickel transport system substrate-binding protein
MKRQLKLVLGTVLVIALIAGCSKKEEGAQGAAGGRPIKDVLVVVANQEIVSTDPADQAQRYTAQFMYNYLEPLMYMDKNNTPQLLLAEKIDQIDDITYEIRLRKGVKFHNGAELKSSDAIFSFKRAMRNSKTASVLSPLDPDGFTKIDDYTFQMKTKEPIAIFYNIIAHSNASIVSEKGVTEKGDAVFRRDASGCGTGPYQFVRWEDGVQAVCERFDDYWGPKAKMKTLEWKFVPDANSRSVMLEVGEADVITQVQIAGIEALVANPDVTVYSIPSNTVRFLFMNQSKGLPLENKALRQAIAYAIDTDALVENIFGKYAQKATSFLGPTILGHIDDIETYEYDPEKAKAKLAEAGYKPGECKIVFSMFSQTIQYSMAEIIQADLKKIGIEMEIKGLDSAAWVAALAEGRCQLGFNSNSNIRADPDVLTTPVSSALIPAPNHGCVNDPRIDAYLEEGRRTFDIKKREQIYIDAQRLIAGECYLYPLAYDNITTATRSDLKGFELYPSETFSYANVYYE